MRNIQYILQHTKTGTYISFDANYKSDLNALRNVKVFGSKTVAGAFRLRWEEFHPDIMLDITPVHVVTTL